MAFEHKMRLTPFLIRPHTFVGSLIADPEKGISWTGTTTKHPASEVSFLLRLVHSMFFFYNRMVRRDLALWAFKTRFNVQDY